MLHIQKINSLDLPELQPYRTLRRHEDHRQQRIFVAEGEKTLRRLLETLLVVVSVLITPGWLSIFEPSQNFGPKKSVLMLLDTAIVLKVRRL